MQSRVKFYSSALPLSAVLALAGPLRAEEVASLDATTLPSPSGPATPAGASGPASPQGSADTARPGETDGNPRSRSMDNMLSVFGVLGYGYTGLGSAPGIGARYQKQLASELAFRGPKLHDDIGFEGGIDYVHYSWSVPGFPQDSWTYNEVSALAGVTWNVWISDQFVVYPKVELAYGFGSVSTNAGFATPGYGGLWFQGAGGVAYKLGSFAMRAEAGWRALRLGAGMAF